MNEQTQTQQLIKQEIAPPASMLAVIDRAARDPSIDVSKMERLLALAEQIHAREAKAQYDQDMSAAQAEMRTISRDCHNPQTRSKYASYEAIDTAIRPIFTAHGFAMSFGSRPSASPDHVIVTCRVSHRAGHTELVELDMPADGKGAKGNDVMTKTHATGSALSYAQRYIAKLVWNLSFGESDDDGNAAGARPSERREELKPAVATEKTRAWMLEQLSQFATEDLLRFWAADGFNIKSLDRLPLSEVPTTKAEMAALLRKIEDWSALHTDKPDVPKPKPEPDFSEPFWKVKITVPRAGQKRADYLKDPDFIGSLYESMKSGDQAAQKRLWGLAHSWQPSTWINQVGEEQQPSEEDVAFRKALDEFLAWEEARK